VTQTCDTVASFINTKYGDVAVEVVP